MKFGNSLIIAGVFALAACSGSTSPQSEENVANTETTEEVLDFQGNIDIDNSVVGWYGEMLGMYSHSGEINIKEGNLEVSNGQIAGGQFTIDMTSIVPTDNGYNPEEGRTKEKLVGHLSSPDFFDVTNYPTSTFVIESVENDVVTGTLTIRGKSDTETIENLKITKDGENYRITGDLVFDRQKYDVSFQMTAQDMVLGDEIKISIDLVVS